VGHFKSAIIFEPDSQEPMNSDVFQLIRCPITQSSLIDATSEQLEELNRKIAAGDSFDRLGRAISGALENALINEDQSYAMPVRGGIITLIADEAIVLKS